MVYSARLLSESLGNWARGFESLSLRQSSLPLGAKPGTASFLKEIFMRAPIAQLDRASDYGSEG